MTSFNGLTKRREEQVVEVAAAEVVEAAEEPVDLAIFLPNHISHPLKTTVMGRFNAAVVKKLNY